MTLSEALGRSPCGTARRRASDGSVYTVMRDHGNTAYVIRHGQLIWKPAGIGIAEFADIPESDAWFPIPEEKRHA